MNEQLKTDEANKNYFKSILLVIFTVAITSYSNGNAEIRTDLNNKPDKAYIDKEVLRIDGRIDKTHTQFLTEIRLIRVALDLKQAKK